MMRFENILYVAEHGVHQDYAIGRTVDLARANHANLTVFDVVTERPSSLELLPGSSDLDHILSWKVDEKTHYLEELIRPYADTCDIQIKVIKGRKKYLEAVKGVLDHGYDLIIKPVEDPDWINRLFGSEDMHLLRKSPCPVWLIKEDKPKKYRNVLAAIDFDIESPEVAPDSLSQSIMRMGLGVAASDSASLHIAHVWNAPEAQYVRDMATDPENAERKIVEGIRQRHRTAAEGMLQALKRDVGAEAYDYVGPKLHLPMGEAHKEIPAMTERLSADLVVMGTVARSGIPGLIIGNTAEAILDQIHCSLLALKPKGFISPVQ